MLFFEALILGIFVLALKVDMTESNDSTGDNSHVVGNLLS
jgi:hypothetical protein